MLVVTRTRYALTALAGCFAFWKSPFSDGVIQLCGAATGVAISRTVDWTDLTALSVLPFTLSFYRAAKAGKTRRDWCCALSCLISLFAFTATSSAPTPQQRAAFRAAVAEFEFTDEQPNYSFSVDRRTLYHALEGCGFRVSGGTAIFPNPGKHSAYLSPSWLPPLRDRTGKPELFGASFDIDDSTDGVTIRLTKLSVTRAGRSISRADAIRIFESRVVSPLRHAGASSLPVREEVCVATGRAATYTLSLCHPPVGCGLPFTGLAVSDLVSC